MREGGVKGVRIVESKAKADQKLRRVCVCVWGGP